MMRSRSCALNASTRPFNAARLAAICGLRLDQFSLALLRRQRFRLIAHVDTLNALATADDAAGRGFDFAHVLGRLTEVAPQIADALLEQLDVTQHQSYELLDFARLL